MANKKVERTYTMIVDGERAYTTTDRDEIEAEVAKASQKEGYDPKDYIEVIESKVLARYEVGMRSIKPLRSPRKK